jgi:hypothetical protein
LARHTGFSVYERENTLKKMTEGSMPGFSVHMVDVNVEGTAKKCQMMVMD